ncbi:hypothetical protein [Blastococcus aggregatus]|nr:hypothetical protein [Blastococcus aggregatus]
MQRATAGQLAGIKVGDTWALLRSEVTARAAGIGLQPAEVGSYP